MAIEVEKITKVHTEVYEWPRHDTHTHTHKKGLLCHINCDETVFVSHWSWFFFRLFVKANQISMQNFISSVQMAPSMGQRLMFFLRFQFDDLLMFDWIHFAHFHINSEVSDSYFCWITQIILWCWWRCAHRKPKPRNVNNCSIDGINWRMKCSKYGFNFNELKNVHIPFKQAFVCYWWSIFVFFLSYLIYIFIYTLL